VRVLVIDNYDSFVYNLVQALEPLGARCEVKRNDQIDLDGIALLEPAGIVISPGPCTPNEAGVSCAAIRRFAGRIPILGVCLGHQALGQVFGGVVVRAGPVHGKTSLVHHDGRSLFTGLPSPFPAARYHSLVVEAATLPEALVKSAWTEDGLIMGLRHRDLPAVEGVQFHPESFMSPRGPDLLRAWVERELAPRAAS
jgi:anthranilate synthase/aminodeoxychorismate synthase-like glutamine amidotransferase